MKRIVVFLGFSSLLPCSLWAQSIPKPTTPAQTQVASSRGLKLPWKMKSPAPVPTSAERITEKARIATSFRLANDTERAEQAYAELVATGATSPDYVQYHLYYAQALAANGKFRESQTVYETYEKLLQGETAHVSPVKKTEPVTVLVGDAADYTIERLPINTSYAEFSPTLYRDGLVFVSTRGKQRSRLLNWGKTRYLDLYYIPEMSNLGGTSRAESNAMKPLRLGRDSYTAPTANDSKTVGTFAGGTPVLETRKAPRSGIRPFMSTINSQYNDGPATFTKNGSQVIFTRNNYNKGIFGKSSEGINKLKLYTATQVRGRWSKASELPFNSDEFSTGHPALAKGPNGEPDQRLYFASDRPGGLGGTDIYVSTWTEGRWGPPVNLGPVVNSAGHELFPFVDEDGNLYLASDGHGGVGGLDNFYVQLDANSQPSGSLTNLGTPLNSPSDDFGVITDGKRNTGYFSSNRAKGGADDDVFRFLRRQEVNACRELTLAVTDIDTREPLANAQVAVDSPVNGSQHLMTDANGLIKICLTAESDTRFDVSREGYAGTKIGYSTHDFSDTQASRLDVTLTRLVAQDEARVQGHVLSQITRMPIANAEVVLVNECDGSLQKTTTAADGAFSFPANADCSYQLEAIKSGMGSVGTSVPRQNTDAVDLLMFTKGDVIQIENIYYGLNKATLRPEATRELDKVVDLMTKYPAMTIEMRSHTDSRATTQYNKVLSTNRAKVAAGYLMSKGIAPRRVQANGYGESLLLNKCADGVACSENEHQQNRRTEIKILTVE
jgi:outer membrane protein OmpA-like peptidoglycan-associated protein